MAQDQNELFAVESDSGDWINSSDGTDFSVYTSRAEAQDALDSHCETDEEAAHYKIVRFVREGTANGG